MAMAAAGPRRREAAAVTYPSDKLVTLLQCGQQIAIAAGESRPTMVAEMLEELLYAGRGRAEPRR